MRNKRSIEYDIAYMKMAIALSELSYGERSKVGCIIVNCDGQIISQGYNGTPTKMNNCCENVVCNSQWRHGCVRTSEAPKPSIQQCKGCDYVQLTTKKEVLHAESNAIVKCAKNGSGTTNNCTLYVTLGPCYDCAKLIIQAGVKRVVYNTEYRDMCGLNFLVDYGIEVDKIDIEKKTVTRIKRDGERDTSSC